MRTLTVIAGSTLALLALVASPAASAGTAAGTGDVVPADAIPVQMVPARSVKLYPDEVADLKGAFYLSNGAVLKVNAEGKRLSASFDGQRAVELTPLTRSLLVSKDGSVRIDYMGAPQDGVIRVAYNQ